MASKKGATTTTGPAGVNKSHKSFQPILPCGNKLLQQRWDQTYYDQHKTLVKTAKPMVDNKAPPSRPHVMSKLKKQQLEKERLGEVDRDNMTLLKKMQRIMKTEGGVDHRNTYHHHSLNQLQRQREVERVVKENREMIKRLETVKPMYKVSEWVSDWQRKEELMTMITSYPENKEPIPVAKQISQGKGKDDSQDSAVSEEPTSPLEIVDKDTGTEKNN